jgi:hypothetical protein
MTGVMKLIEGVDEGLFMILVDVMEERSQKQAMMMSHLINQQTHFA